MKRDRVAVVVGTRPEAIKLAPVVRALRDREDIDTVVVSTGQHRQMLDQVFSRFGLQPDVELSLMQPDQTLADLTARALSTMDGTLAALSPRLLLVQGDTTTAFAAALSAFYRRVPVAHVEAGLRSGDIDNPYPEEANRRLASVVVSIHFTPTRLSRKNLLDEGVPADRVLVTGNTVVDALHTILETPCPFEGTPIEGLRLDGRLLLVTSHRRESWGQDLQNICLALLDIVERHPDVRVVYPVHLNPNVRTTVRGLLEGVDRIHLTEPLDYLVFVNLLRRCHFILTDSGGVQEEAPTLHKPLLLLRAVTERPEAFALGVARIVGTGREDIVREAERLLSDPQAYARMAGAANPYGDGCASDRIALALARWLHGERPLLHPWEELAHGAPVPAAEGRAQERAGEPAGVPA
jgi:UDP-N-acetylglucosamine 2-epimerase (non-hydrolysing)